MKRFLSYTAVGLVLGFGAFALAQNVSNYMEQGGARWVIGGSLDIASGGDLDIESGASLKIAGTTVSLAATEFNDVTVQVHLDDIGLASTSYVVSYFAGDVTDWYCVLDKAFAGSDAVLVLSVNGAQPVSTDTLTVAQSGSAPADVDSGTVSSGAAIAVGEVIGIGSDGGPTDSGILEVCTVVIGR